MNQYAFRLLVLIVTVGFVFGEVQANNGFTVQDKQALLKINKEYDDALVAGDIKALELIFADEFVYTSTSGEVVNRAQQLEVIKSGGLKIASGISEDVEVRLYGDIAIVTGRFVARGEFKGKGFDSIERYTSVWLKRDRRWQLVAEQGTLVPKP